MPTAGITVTQECIDVFNDLKLKKQIRYIIYKIDETDMKSIVVDEYGSEEDYEVFRQKIINKQDPKVKGKMRPSYAVYDLQYEIEDEGWRSKIAFISYSHDTDTSIKSRMVYASSLEGLKSALNGIGVERQAHDQDDLEYDGLAKLAAGRAKLAKHQK